MSQPTHEARAIRRVAITGSDGLIGRTLMEALKDRYELVGVARKPSPWTTVQADITDLPALVEAFDGVDAVVHMAATSAVGSSWEDVLSSNLIGTYNVFEAARRDNVDRVIFASQSHDRHQRDRERARPLRAGRPEGLGRDG